jgi:hypothetical protein
MTEKWVNVKSWGDLKVGDRFRQNGIGEKEISGIDLKYGTGTMNTYIEFSDGTGILFDSANDPQDPALKTQRLTIETGHWQDLKSWGDLKKGDRVKTKDGSQYKVRGIKGSDVNGFDIQFRDVKTGYTVGPTNFDDRIMSPSGKAWKWVATETGHLEPVKSWHELKPGKVKCISNRKMEEFTVRKIDMSGNPIILETDEFGTLTGDPRADLRDPLVDMHQWIEDDDTGESDFDPWKTLKQACAPAEEAPAKKEIPKYPHKCLHCGADSYNSQWETDCSADCEGSRT